MSPRKIAPPSPRVEAELRRVGTIFGDRVRTARVARRWSVAELASRAGLSPDMIYRIEGGAPASMLTATRLAVALGRPLDIDLRGARRQQLGESLSVDVVHSRMGEFEARRLRLRGYRVGMDEPYQHYQFAGRADVVAWDLDRGALLHIENRTRFPDFQEMAGAFNAKRSYLGAALAARLGIARWARETHALVALWSSEVLHALRLREHSFRSLCGESPDAWTGWWEGRPPEHGSASILIVLDPKAAGRQRPFIGLDAALMARPRYRGYADAAAQLDRAA